MSDVVKWFRSDLTGAPVCNGTAGALIAMLDATLVNGFGLQTAASLTVASGVATMALTATPTATVGMVVLVAGSTPAELNGEKRVLSTTSNSLTFASTSPDGAATGTITVKMAPAGWEKVFTGTNLAVYRSPNVQSTRQYLRVDDTTTTTARVRAYEGMTDVNTGVDQWMDNYWFKSHNADATPRFWYMIADDRTFYLRIEADRQEAVYPFGDINQVRPNDPYAAIGPNGYDVTTTNSGSNDPARVSANVYPFGMGAVAQMRMPRSGNYLSKNVTAYRRPQIPGPHYVGSTSAFTSSGVTGGTPNYVLPYPNTSDNALVFGRFNVLENANNNLRGHMRGVFCSPQNLNPHFGVGLTVIDGQGDLAGRKVGVLGCPGGINAEGSGIITPCNNAQNPAGRLIVDLTGPW